MLRFLLLLEKRQQLGRLGSRCHEYPQPEEVFC